MMPLNLFLVRHGESEGNIATKRSRKGDNSLHTPEYLARHSSSWRLTDKGIEQAKTAGYWIKEHFYGGEFQAHYVSAYLRAMETAAHFDLPNAQWRMESHLCERNWGDMDVMTDKERLRLFSRNLDRRDAESFFWRPPNGESIADVCATRVYRHISTLHRLPSTANVIMVLHGELMWAFRATLERMSPAKFAELDASTDSFDRIHNCQVIQYSRRDPVTNETASCYKWMRSVCPSELSKSRNTWENIQYFKYTNVDLHALVANTTRLISG